jgi:hypothetical protein
MWSASSLTTTRRVLSNIAVKRSYVSRAHPRPVAEYPVNTAIQMVLQGVEERKAKRVTKWERNAPVRQAKGKEVCSINL